MQVTPADLATADTSLRRTRLAASSPARTACPTRRRQARDVCSDLGGVLAGGLASRRKSPSCKRTPVSDPGGYIASATAAYTAQFGGTLFNAGGTIGVEQHVRDGAVELRARVSSARLHRPRRRTVRRDSTADRATALSCCRRTATASWSSTIRKTSRSGARRSTRRSGAGACRATSRIVANAPFQVDTDSLTIASIVKGCNFNILFGAAGGAVAALANPDGSGVKPVCGDTRRTRRRDRATTCTPPRSARPRRSRRPIGGSMRSAPTSASS